MNDEQASVPYGYCQCGCGQKTKLSPKTTSARGYVKGEPYPFIKGHHWRPFRDGVAREALKARWAGSEIPYGYCLCGCGEETKAAPSTYRRLGYVRGEPRPYLTGHHKKKDRYRVEDCGYQTPCWLWLLQTGLNGYGYVALKREGRGQVLAHRVMYEEAIGPIPQGHHLHHRCENTRCVNPAHLEPLTPAEHRKRHVKV